MRKGPGHLEQAGPFALAQVGYMTQEVGCRNEVKHVAAVDALNV